MNIEAALKSRRSRLSRRVLILGGYGNFGSRIAQTLAASQIGVIIAGRNLSKAEALAASLGSTAHAAYVNANEPIDQLLKQLKPFVVIHCCGPFQNADYHIANACITSGIHYIDLADARDFVCGITALDTQAKAKRLCVISGASTVPALSSAVIEHYGKDFSQIESVMYGISPGQKSPRGLATTQSILSYLGKAMKPAADDVKPRYGWQDLYRQRYPLLGMRWMANCDIPDFDLFPARYSIRHIRFSAGMENGLLHLSMWLTGWLIRLGLPLQLTRHASALLRISTLFDRFGSDRGGMHVVMHGRNQKGMPHEQSWFIIASNGDGPQIPCVPAIILAKKLVAGEAVQPGAQPCMGMITLDEYLAELTPFAVNVFDTAPNA